jgi:hypothetical protein
MKFDIDGETFTCEIMFPEDVIENEIAQGLTQKQIAQTYALAMRKANCTWTVDWARINKAIIARWSVKGLERIKKLAWSGKAFE